MLFLILLCKSFVDFIIAVGNPCHNLCDELWEKAPIKMENLEGNEMEIKTLIKSEQIIFDEKDQSVEQKCFHRVKIEQLGNESDGQNGQLVVCSEAEFGNFADDHSADIKLGQTHPSECDRRNYSVETSKRILDGETKLALINEFHKRKRECQKREKKLKKNYNKYKVKIEGEIARDLGTNRKMIYKWKKALGQKCIPKPQNSKKHKLKIIKKYETVRKEFEAKFDLIMPRNVSEKVAHKIGVNYNTIYRWKKEFGLSRKRRFSDAEKLELVRKFDEIKRKNRMLNSDRVAETLAVTKESIRKWRTEFGIEAKWNCNYTEEEKMNLIRKFDKIKGKNPRLNSGRIAEELGTTQKSIRKWRAKLGTKS